MRLKLYIAILTLLLSSRLVAQEKYPVDWDYKTQSFREFVTKAESILPVKFYFKEEWVAGLRLSDYPGCVTLQAVLSNLFRDIPLHFFIDNAGNVVITRDFAVKRPDVVIEDVKLYIPTTYFAESGDTRQKTENMFVEIGSRVDRNRPGNVTVSGYVTNTDTREKVGGATVSLPKLSKGTVSNEYGFYSITLPRGTYEVQFSFVGMKEKKINLKVSEESLKWLASKGYSKTYGAREISRIIQDKIKNHFVDEVLFGKRAKGGKASVKIEKDDIAVQFGE
jgi:hypothetical protein